MLTRTGAASTIWGSMKRIFFLTTSVFFIFFIIFKTPLFAQDTVVQTDTPLGAEAPASPSSQMEPQRVAYELTYPGMLPDNPFYILKVIRDGIVKMLINDPLKRAQFSLLNSDKRMYAGRMLVDKGKDKLALETIAKSNNYLDDALTSIMEAQKQNQKSMDIKPFLLQMKASAQKHREMMGDMDPNIDSSLKKSYAAQKQRMQTVEKNVVSILKQR